MMFVRENYKSLMLIDIRRRANKQSLFLSERTSLVEPSFVKVLDKNSFTNSR